jgi:hypothetical protein
VLNRVVGLKWEPQWGWVNLNRNPKANSSCVPPGTHSVDDAAVLADFRKNVPVTKARSGVAAYLVVLPKRYELVAGWRKKGNDPATRCEPPTKVGDVYVFRGY